MYSDKLEGQTASGERGSLVAFSAVAVLPIDSVRVPPMGLSLRQESQRLPMRPVGQPSCLGQPTPGLTPTGVPDPRPCTHTYVHTHIHIVGED